jgi:hypothetical protein
MNESSDATGSGSGTAHESFGSADPGSGSGQGHESSGSAPGPHPTPVTPDPASQAKPATDPATPAAPSAPASGGNRNVGLLVGIGIAVLVVLAAIVGLVVK